MIDRRTLSKDELREMMFLGKVVDSQDPTHSGRCRVRVFGMFDELADDELPWAQPQLGLSFGQNGTSGAISVPKVGSVVHVRFDNGNLYSPVFHGLQEPAADLVAEIANSYTNAHSLVYDGDEELRIYYTQEKGLTMYLKHSRINIANDNTITIEHKDTRSIIELRGPVITITADSEVNITGQSRVKLDSAEVWAHGKQTKVGDQPAYSAVLAEPLWAFLKVLSAAVDAKLYATPGAMSGACATAEQLATSKTVKVSM
jgi:hypothetical protein